MSEVSNALVVFMGLGTVFVGLICIIVICMIMGAICKRVIKEDKVIAPANVTDNSVISNKQEIIAATCAVIAEELGTEAKNIRVVSFKKA